MTNAFVFFAGDICWAKCRTKGKTRQLPLGRVVHLCDNCSASLGASEKDRLSVREV